MIKIIYSKRLGQRKNQENWLSLPEDLRNSIKNACIKLLVLDNLCNHEIAQTIGYVASIEWPKNHWPECLEVLMINVLKSYGREVLKEANLLAINCICQQFLNNHLVR